LFNFCSLCICRGDSGGPLFRKELKKPFKQGIDIWIIYGLTSFSHAGCGQGAPAFYVNVNFYKPWIDKKISESKIVTTATIPLRKRPNKRKPHKKQSGDGRQFMTLQQQQQLPSDC